MVYDPASGVPKIPTANSTQMSRRTAKITAQRTIRWLGFCTFLMTSSHSKPDPSNRIPATIKSIKVQLTPVLNCIATNGISNRNATVNKIPINLLFFMIFNFYSTNIINFEIQSTFNLKNICTLAKIN